MAADTDNASQLVAQLLEKLASLDNKVQLYRQDMAREFQRHSRELLEDVPKDVAAKVEQTVADSLHNYTVLNPGFTDLACSVQSEQLVDPIERINLDRKARAGSRSPPPKLPHTSGVPREQVGDGDNSGPRSPHEREHEFHAFSVPSSTSLGTVATLRPDPTRRHTAETLSSVTSDDSTSRSRPRSALRRSSSSSTKTQSPRRVRFEVEGAEVLPTMSPMLSPRLSDLPSSSLNRGDNLSGQFDEQTSLQGSLRSDYNDDTPVTELLGTSPPRPKKVSSTDRLKALARSSKEDTSKWTVVGNLLGSDDDDDELVMGGRSRRQRGTLGQAAGPAQPTQSSMTQQPVSHRTNDPRLPSQLSSGLPVVQERDENADAEEAEECDDGEDSNKSDDSDESDELMMPSRKSTINSQQPRASAGASAPLTKSAPTAASTGTSGTSRSSVAPSISSTATSTSEDGSEGDEEEEDMFGFDDENQPPSTAANQTTTKKYIEDEDEDEEGDSDSPVVESMRKPTVPSSLPRSVTMTKAPPLPKSPTSAMANALMGTSMGSYKGRSIILGSVKNEQLHEQASRMGNFTSFVGSVDGRTGVDEKGSYRPEGISFAGKPKSLSERMLKEELEEEEAARRSGSTPT